MSEVRGEEGGEREKEAGREVEERDFDGFPFQEVWFKLVSLKAEAQLGAAKV